MIIKSKSRHRATWRQLLEYIERGADERSMVVTHNVRGSTIEEWEAEFREAESWRTHHRKGNVVLYHEVMSFHDEDSSHVTRELLEDLSLKYIDLRAAKGLVVAMSHHDREHVHVHFCISGVEHSTGRSMRMSQSTFTAVKKTMQAYQQKRYPELVNSIADHGKRSRQIVKDKEYLLKQRTGGPSQREQIAEQLKALLVGAPSMVQFTQKLHAIGAELYHRNGKPQGILVNGVKYRFTTMGVDRSELERLTGAPDRISELQRIRSSRTTRERPMNRGKKEQW